MKISRIALAIAALLGSSGILHATPAARVLVLAGEASVTRNGQQIQLSNGALIESGDTIQVGEKSALQIRFTDNRQIFSFAAVPQRIVETGITAGMAGIADLFNL